MIGHRRADDLVGQDARIVFDHLAQIQILHRVLVRTELEFAAHGGEIGGAQRLAEGVAVSDLGLGGGRQDQVRGVKPLCRIDRGQAVIGLLDALTKVLLAALSRSGDQLAVLCTPSAASPTAGRMS